MAPELGKFPTSRFSFLYMLFHLSSLTGTFGAFESFQIKVFLWVDFDAGTENRKWELCHMSYVLGLQGASKSGFIQVEPYQWGNFSYLPN